MDVIVAAIFCFTGALVNANLLGELATIVQDLNKRDVSFQSKIDLSNTAMKNMKLPLDIQYQVISYYKMTESSLDQQKELDQFLVMISPSLRRMVTEVQFEVFLKQNEVFRTARNKIDLDSNVYKLVTKL